MLKSISLCMNHARRVDVGKTITFNHGLNVIVGPNGSGKSTLLRSIVKCDDCVNTISGKTDFHYFDSEKMNPKTTDSSSQSVKDMILRIRSLFSSHGEIMKTAMTALPVQKGDCLLMDEPEAGQDLDGILRIQEGFKAICETGGQVIIASHHPLFWRNGHIIELQKGYCEKICAAYRDILCKSLVS